MGNMRLFIECFAKPRTSLVKQSCKKRTQDGSCNENKVLSTIECVDRKGQQFLSVEKYELLIQQINTLKHGNRKNKPKDYQLLKQYDVVQIGNVEQDMVLGKVPPGKLPPGNIPPR